MNFWKKSLVPATIAAGLIMGNSCSPSTNSDSPNQKGDARGFNAPPKEAGEKDRYAAITEPGVPVGLGFGIDLDNRKGIANKCIDGTTQDVPQQEGFLSLDADYSRDQIESSIGVQSEGSLSFLSWGASARGEFAQKSREQGFGLNYIVFAYNKDHSKVFVPSARTETWKTSSPEEWKTSCGGGYVAAQDFGSMLVIRFSLRLNQKDLERSWGASGGGNFLSFAKLKASINGQSKSSKATGTLSVSALQIGGKPSELGKILKTNSESGLIESFALCDVAEVAKCLAGLRSIEDYMANVFPKQIDDQEKAGSALLRTYPFLYPKTMGGDFNPGLDQFVLKARKDLASLYDSEMNDLVQLQAYGHNEDTDLNKIRDQAKQNLGSIRDASQLCYQSSTYKECTARAQEIAIACAETVVPEYVKEGQAPAGGKGSSSKE